MACVHIPLSHLWQYEDQIKWGSNGKVACDAILEDSSGLPPLCGCLIGRALAAWDDLHAVCKTGEEFPESDANFSSSNPART